MCGAIRPTKPIGPQTATTAPTISDTAKNSSSFVWLTSTPRLEANSSPVREQVQLVRQVPDDQAAGGNQRHDVQHVVEADHAVQPAHHPAEHAVGAGEVADVLEKEDQAGEEEAHGHAGQQHRGRRRALPAAGGQPVDQQDRHHRPEKRRQRDARDAHGDGDPTLLDRRWPRRARPRWQTPSVNGVASGLRNMAWKAMPLVASAAPARNAIATRGMRSFQRMSTLA